LENTAPKILSNGSDRIRHQRMQQSNQSGVQKSLSAWKLCLLRLQQLGNSTTSGKRQCIRLSPITLSTSYFALHSMSEAAFGMLFCLTNQLLGLATELCNDISIRSSVLIGCRKRIASRLERIPHDWNPFPQPFHSMHFRSGTSRLRNHSAYRICLLQHPEKGHSRTLA
jgi:hypothetical protein